MSRRTLHIVSGTSVLFAALTLGHVIHHFFMMTRHDLTAGTAAGFVMATIALIFSIVGGYLLLMGGRESKT